MQFQKITNTQQFMRALKNKICKYLTVASTNLCNNKFLEIVKEFDNVNHKLIKMKTADGILLISLLNSKQS